MFGYVITNKPELKIREFARIQRHLLRSLSEPEREVWQNRADDPYV